MGDRRNLQNTSSGKAYREDDSVLDVTEWREDLKTTLSDLQSADDSKTQNINNQDHLRIKSPGVELILSELLTEVKKMNNQLSFITGEEL